MNVRKRKKKQRNFKKNELLSKKNHDLYLSLSLFTRDVITVLLLSHSPIPGPRSPLRGVDVEKHVGANDVLVFRSPGPWRHG
jgi:hypothetical protein